MSWPLRRMKPSLVEQAFGPPLTPEELTGNLSLLERKLNREMKCTAGKNQVYIRSLLTGQSTTRPRIALKCPLRRDIKLPPEVYYEHIRDVCCANHEQCEAWLAFQGRHVRT
jgi:hypothetical protein